MNNLWLKIKIWTKVAVFTLVGAYLLVFVVNNASERVTFWWFPYKGTVETTVLWFSLSVFFIGVIGAILTRMIFRTIRQITDLRERNRVLRNERDLAEMKQKAARLQSAPTGQPPHSPLT